MLIIVTFLWMFTVLYSYGYMADEHSQTRYYTALTSCLGVTVGIVTSANLLTMFIFFELLTCTVYPLVIHEETDEAWRAGVMYGAYLLGGGALVFAGMLLLYYYSDGNLTFTNYGIPGLALAPKWALYLIFFLFMAGFGVKGAIMPLHAWLPKAMVAPTPISALLHAVAVVNMGIYGIIRVIYNVFGPQLFSALQMDTILALFATMTILGAAIIALKQKQIKRMLAYSTVNQLSYIILGASSVHPYAFMGALLHIFYHAIMKITLFYSAGTIIKHTGKTKLRDMSGLAKRMPITCLGFTVGAIGIIGLPPIAGWISKWNMIEGFLKLGQPVLAIVFIISSIIELGYFLPPILWAFFGKEIEYDSKKYKVNKNKQKWEVPVNMLIPIGVVTLLSLAFGLLGSVPVELSKATVAELLSKTF
ncbi:MAG: proton-conducting transporter membrane subunit [bacterium]